MDVHGVRRVALAIAPLVILASAGASVGAPQGRAEPGPRFELVSANDRGKVADESSHGPSTSRDGRLVAFASNALNLDPRVRPTRNRQVYLWDRRTGHVRAAVRRPGGGITSDAEVPSLSPSGRFLAFCSLDAKLVRPDSRGSDDSIPFADEDVFVIDLRTGRVRRASSDHRGREADGYSCSPHVADTGDVVFSSRATDLVRGDTDKVPDVFLYDWSSQRVRLLTTAEIGDTAFDISADGSTVAVVTTQALVGRDDQSWSDLYVFRRHGGGLSGEWKLGLPRADGTATHTGTIFGGVSISDTGRYVTGMSTDGAIADPPIADKPTHLWLRDTSTGRTTLLNRTTYSWSDVTDAQVSDDGRTVTFVGGSLDYGGVSPDGDDQPELFAWRRGRGVELVTRGSDVFGTHSSGTSLSGDGAWAAFTMLRDDVPGLDPISEPARVVVYLTRLR